MTQFKVNYRAQSENQLAVRVETSLNSRQISSSASYTSEEVGRVSAASRKLVSAGKTLPNDLLESIRAAATLANSELRPNPDFTSHRPLIGGLIVAIKKLTWPLVRFHLHRHFDNQSELNRRMLYNQVKLYEAAIGESKSNKIQSAQEASGQR